MIRPPPRGAKPLDVFIEKVGEHGILGLILAMVLTGYVFKDRALQREKDARIADSKALTDIAMRLQEQHIAAVDKLAAIFDEMKKLWPGRRGT